MQDKYIDEQKQAKGHQTSRGKIRLRLLRWILRQVIKLDIHPDLIVFLHQNIKYITERINAPKQEVDKKGASNADQ